MNSIFKKSAIAIAILGLAGSAYAGTISGAFIGAEGVDLQPRTGDLDFVTVLPSGVGTVSTAAIHPSYSWDFRVYAGLNFCGGDDLTVSWLRFHTNDHNDFGTPLAPLATTPFTSQTRFLFDDDWSSIYAKVDFNLDEVYGVFAHTAHMGPWDLRFGAGAEWARLNSDMTVQGVDSGGTTLAYDNHSHLHGVGPRVELDMTYGMPYNFGIFARTNLALLVASREIALDPIEPTGTDELSTYDFSTRHVIVPKLGIKVGVNFTYGFGGMGGEGMAPSASAVTIEAGWQAESYIHAIERPEGFGNTSSSPFDSDSNFATKTSNYGYQGLFLGVKLSTGWF